MRLDQIVQSPLSASEGGISGLLLSNKPGKFSDFSSFFGRRQAVSVAVDIVGLVSDQFVILVPKLVAQALSVPSVCWLRAQVTIEQSADLLEDRLHFRNDLRELSSSFFFNQDFGESIDRRGQTFSLGFVCAWSELLQFAILAY